MQALTSFMVILALALTPSMVLGQQSLSTEDETAAFKKLASAIPPGTRLKIRTKDGRRMTATLMAADEHRIVVKRDARVPEPAVGIGFAELARLERAQKGGFSVGKALGIGLAAGAGAILTLFAIAVTIDD
jgi:hypothetical protein